MKPRKVTSSPPFEPAEQEIQHAAYFLWQEEGCPVGRDLELWLAAKELLRHRRHSAPRYNLGLSDEELRKECAGITNGCDADDGA